MNAQLVQQLQPAGSQALYRNCPGYCIARRGDDETPHAGVAWRGAAARALIRSRALCAARRRLRQLSACHHMPIEGCAAPVPMLGGLALQRSLRWPVSQSLGGASPPSGAWAWAWGAGRRGRCLRRRRACGGAPCVQRAWRSGCLVSSRGPHRPPGLCLATLPAPPRPAPRVGLVRST